MLHRIACLLEPLLRLLCPPPGGTGTRTGAVPGEQRSPPRVGRPYLLAHERRAQARQQRARRRTLWLAVHGIDVGPRRIHGVDVGSRRTPGAEAAVA
ncbi:hypothetical protein [Streptomyces sp. b94]|uniref:hypothetical protein n=1 Tax=Streptomyces sp. b94 TaxID=1827634 RepID=UPI0027DE389E|nr:hypothetical protein [Streptomyces sp. b94]